MALVGRRVSSERVGMSEGDIVVPMEAMGEAYYRLANNDRVGGAVKAGARCELGVFLTGVCGFCNLSNLAS